MIPSPAQDGRDLWAPLAEQRPTEELLRVWDEGKWVCWSWTEWQRRSLRVAGGLRAAGVHQGDRVAALLDNSASACTAALGTWLAGGCLVSLPALARGMAIEQYVAQIAGIVRQAEPGLLVVPAPYVDLMTTACPRVRVRPIEGLEKRALREPALAEPDDSVFVQYSSGSTSWPQGCVVSAGAIARQLTMLARALELDPENDVQVGWVPLSHDMGFFGCLMLSAYWTGVPLVLSSPQRFLLSPHSWFADCAEFGATLSCGPNFSLELVTKTAPLLAPGRTRMRKLVNGGERIFAGTMDRLCAALGPDRLPREALLPAYGLAEAVLAVTMTPLRRGPVVHAVDRTALAAGAIQFVAADEVNASEDVTLIPSVGPPLAGNELDVVGGSEVGELRVRSPTLAQGYLGSPELTKARFTPSGLLTGDLGFLHEGEAYITGRKDDLLIVAGRNVYARDIESALLGTGGIRAGSCAVVQIDDGVEPRVVAVVEPVAHHPDFTLMAGRMATAAMSVAGVRLSECLFLPYGVFPKTPTGKTQRFRCQELAGDQSFSAVARVAL